MGSCKAPLAWFVYNVFVSDLCLRHVFSFFLSFLCIWEMWLIYMSVPHFMWVPWVIHMRDMLNSHMWWDSFKSVKWLVDTWHAAFMTATWLTHMSDRTHSYVWRDTLICTLTGSYVWRCWLMCVSGLIRMWIVRHLSVFNNKNFKSFIDEPQTERPHPPLHARTHARTHAPTHARTHPPTAHTVKVIIVHWGSVGCLQPTPSSEWFLKGPHLISHTHTHMKHLQRWNAAIFSLRWGV